MMVQDIGSSQKKFYPFYTEIKPGIVDNYVDKCSILWISLRA